MSVTNISIAGNPTNADSRLLYHYDIAQLLVYMLVLPILGVFGIVGNILTIVVLGRDDVMKKTTRFLLRNLATADIGILIIFVLRKAFDTIIPHYTSPEIDQLYCSMEPYLMFIAHVFQVTDKYIFSGNRNRRQIHSHMSTSTVWTAPYNTACQMDSGCGVVYSSYI